MRYTFFQIHSRKIYHTVALPYTRMTAVIFRFVPAFLLLVICGISHAHSLRPAVTTIDFEENGAFSISIRTNAEALVARIGNEHEDTRDSPNAEEYNRLRALSPIAFNKEFGLFGEEFARSLQMKIDGSPVNLYFTGIEVPAETDPELDRSSEIQLRGNLPSDSTHLQWHYPAAYGDCVLRIRFDAKAEFQSYWLPTGQESPVIPLDADVIPRSRKSIVSDYLQIGFTHILPLGLDHILFVIGIFLFSLKLGPIIWQVTAFTVAHTITLGLAMYGVVSLPSGVVEPLIAASIVYVGVENILSTSLHSWRILLVFIFGLLHGMGFAGVLTELGLPEGEFLTALISFNVGVELGQLSVIGLAFVLVGWWRNKDWYRNRVIIPGSMTIALIGAYWTVERLS